MCDLSDAPKQTACHRYGYGTDGTSRFVSDLLKQAARYDSAPFTLPWRGRELEVPPALGAGRCLAGGAACCLSFGEHVDSLFRVWAANEAIDAGLDGYAGATAARVNPHFATQASLCRHDALTYAEVLRLEDLSPTSFETLNAKLGNAAWPGAPARGVMRPAHLHASESRAGAPGAHLVRVLHPSGTGGTTVCDAARRAAGVRMTPFQLEHNCNHPGAGPHTYRLMTAESPWRRCDALDRRESNWVHLEHAFDADFPCGGDVRHVLLFREPFERVYSLLSKMRDAARRERLTAHYADVLEAGGLLEGPPAGVTPEEVTRSVDNPMIRFLLGSEEADRVPFGGIDGGHLARARALVASFDVLLETADVGYAGDVFGALLPPELGFSPGGGGHSNGHRPRAAVGRAGELRERLRAAFRAHNALDYELHEFMLGRRTLGGAGDGADLPRRAEDLLSKLMLAYGEDFEALGHLYDGSEASRQRYATEILGVLLYERSVDAPARAPPVEEARASPVEEARACPVEEATAPGEEGL